MKNQLLAMTVILGCAEVACNSACGKQKRSTCTGAAPGVCPLVTPVSNTDCFVHVCVL